MPTGMPASGPGKVALGGGFVYLGRLREGAFFGQAQINIERRIHLLDALVVRGCEIGGLHVPRCDALA